MFLANNLNKGGSLGGYQISRSLRFNSADSAYLNRTPASTTNRQTWTWSAWVKRSDLTASSQWLFEAAVDGNNRTSFYFDVPNGYLTCQQYTSGSADFNFNTSAVYRDASAWYHFVIVADTTNATQANRLKVYVNNVLQTVSGTLLTQNLNTYVNTTNGHSIGRYVGNILFFSGYLTETNFIDGQALTPSSFGETNAQTGVWQPKAYSGSYGTNGFYLNFSDNINTTAATLGKDYSGNGNNWTPNNFSVAAGAGNDSLVDSPTSYGTDTGVGGTVRGNYGTLNPLFNATTLTNGNLDASLNAISTTGTFGSNSGKWYFECTFTSLTGTSYLGIADQTLVKSDSSFSYSQVYVYLSNSQKGGNGGSATYGSSYTTGDVIGVAYDLDSGSITFYKNGTSQGVAYSTGFTSGYFWRPFLYCSATTTATFNFGQRPFAYTAPSGYKALCTQNLPTPTIGATTATQAGKFFNPVTYTGNGSTQTISGVGFQPDFTWVKCRSNADTAHILQDVIRGAGSTLFSNDTSAQLGNSGDLIGSWNSDGFQVNRNFLGGTTNNSTNGSGQTYVGWNWKANGSGSTNTAGSITTTVSANTTSGFSIALGTTPSSGSATYGHGLGVAPSFIFAKSTAATSDWFVYHTSLGFNQDIRLNTTSAASSTTFTYNSANSSTVTIGGSSVAAYWGGNAPWIWYNFAEVAGYSKFGSYTGNGSTNFIYTGFRPAWIMIKNTTTAGVNWNILDVSRDTYNAEQKLLSANTSNAEDTFNTLDGLSNGFNLLHGLTYLNKSGDTYIYAAFASNPFKYSLAR